MSSAHDREAPGEAKDAARMAVLLACAVLGVFVNAALIVAAAGTVGLLLTQEEARA